MRTEISEEEIVLLCDALSSHEYWQLAEPHERRGGVMPWTYEVAVPGAVETFLAGTGALQGQEYTTDARFQRGAVELLEAWQSSKRIRRGRGHVDILYLPSLEAAVVLAELLEACITRNSDEPDHAELRAARVTLERIEQATHGRVRHDGWNVLLDGERIP